MGERQLFPDIVTAEELIASKRFHSMQDVYNTPDSALPRVRRGGKIVRPLRFYRSDVDRYFSSPRSLTIEQETLEIARPSISFKKGRTKWRA